MKTRLHPLIYRNGEDLSIWSADDVEKPSYRDDPSTEQARPDQSTTSLSSGSVTLAGAPSIKSGSGFSPEGIQSGQDVTASLILDGARAVAAIARPFPIATVGVPRRFDFDIASATFQFSVTVTAADRADTVSTEIYVPFVHYAKNLGESESEIQESEITSRTSLLDNDKASSAASSTSLELDIDVNLTHGSYSTVGQTLTWKYDPPASGEATYTIEIKRKGGAIKRDIGIGNAQQGSWFDVCGGCTIG